MTDEYTKRLEETNKKLENSLIEILDSKNRLKKTLEMCLIQLLSAIEDNLRDEQGGIDKPTRAKIEADFSYHKLRMIVAESKNQNEDVKDIQRFVEDVEYGRLHGET